MFDWLVGRFAGPALEIPANGISDLRIEEGRRRRTRQTHCYPASSRRGQEGRTVVAVAKDDASAACIVLCLWRRNAVSLGLVEIEGQAQKLIVSAKDLITDRVWCLQVCGDEDVPPPVSINGVARVVWLKEPGKQPLVAAKLQDRQPPRPPVHLVPKGRQVLMLGASTERIEAFTVHHIEGHAESDVFSRIGF